MSKVSDIETQRYKDKKIRVCDKNSIPLKVENNFNLCLNFGPGTCKQMYLFSFSFSYKYFFKDITQKLFSSL